MRFLRLLIISFYSMHRTPFSRQPKPTPYSSSMDKDPNRVPTAPLKSRAKGLMPVTVNDITGIGKERLSVLVDKMKDQPFGNKERSKVEIITLPKAESKLRETTHDIYPKMDEAKRPQTSKCSRRKDKQYDSEYHEEDNDDLIFVGNLKAELLHEQPPKKKQTTRAIYSAQPKKSRMKPIDDLIKYNGSCVKRPEVQPHSTHFQTSLGAEFLGLFANN